MATKQVTFSFVDSLGQYAQSTFLSDTEGLGVNIGLKNLTNAGILYDVVGARDTTYAKEGGAALYPSVSQVAQLVFSDGAGSTAVLSIPAPISAMFLPDGITVDTSNTQVALLILNALTAGALLSAAGNSVTSYLRGARVGRGTP